MSAQMSDGALPARRGPLSDADWQQLADYLSGESSPAVTAHLEHRLASDPAFAAVARPVMAAWRAPVAIPPRDAAAGWAAIQQRAAVLRATSPQLGLVDATEPAPMVLARPSLRVTDRSPRPRVRWTQRGLALAATLLIVAIGLRIVWRHQLPRYYYQGGASGAVVTLPDGSRATLAPGSYLGTERGFPTRTRVVYLYGQARFTVAPNPRHPFIVTVPSVSARALGTTFAMRADTTLPVRIDVSQGKVAVLTRDASGAWHQVHVLTAGDAVQVPRLEAWLAQAGYEIGAAGVPFREAMRIGNALRAAAIHTGADATH